MIQQIRNSKVSKVIATYLALMIFVESTQPMMMFALTEGPSQPEFNAFTPIGTSDMVDLASGDLNYNIPIMDVGGYPLNLAYSSGVTMDQEASWVGLGWDLNVGQIARNMRGLPDDFNGDPMVYENNMKPNITVGANVGVFGAALGIKELPIKFDAGIGIKYNNYDGFGSSINGGLTYQINDHMTLGMQMEASDGDGVSVSPSLSYHSKRAKNDKQNVELSGSLGVNYNSRKGIESFTFAASREKKTNKAGKGKGVDEAGNTNRTSVDVSQPYGVNGSVSFQDASFTPSKRVGMVASNFLFNLNLEGEIWGFEPGVKVSGFYAKQGIADSEKVKVERGFGYENTASATGNDVTDFNREKDRTVNRNTTTLPVSNYTYDLYSIQGQGVSGMFRPYRSQVGFLFDKYVEDTSNGGSLGGEVGGGGGAHFGLNATLSHGFSSTGLWGGNNQALPRFYENNSGTKLDYERVYFKNIGGNQVDTDKSLFDNTLNGYSPIKFGIAGGEYNRSTTANYVGTNPSSGVIRRDNRVNRNQTIQMLTVKEAAKYGTKSGQKSIYSKQHHTGEIRITKEGGTRYVYGKALYNTLKKEVTFDATQNEFNNITGLVSYSAQDASVNNDKKGDQYFNRITTPAYAHSYLLTSVLSSDYQDLKNDGLTDDDLGSYTKFIYKNTDKLYKWRVPFDLGKANFDEGLKSLEKDNKGNYQYGEKELTYIQKIVTKTHVAVFESSPRKDSFGVLGEEGGLGADSQMYKLNTIKLYSKPEYDASPENATPIKTAHFVYNYDLCKGIKNNSGSQALDAIETSNAGGKLTLQKVYFTYKNSKMGEYTPYTFQYSSQNPNYDMKAYDVWGYYKPKADNLEAGLGMTGGGLSNTEYPFVDQNKNTADNYATSWHLSTINLPSGGKINLDYESDDYKHVQDQEVMQMFKVVGVGKDEDPSEFGTSMYSTFNRNKYIYIEVPNGTTDDIVEKKYIKNLRNREMYFRFLLNMDQYDTLYDYVTGYVKLGSSHKVFLENIDGVIRTFTSIEIEEAQLGDGVYNSQPVNPISKAGWIFARQNLNRIAYGLGGNEENKTVKAIIMDVLGTATAIFQIFSSPNGFLKTKGIADTFIPNKSWVRLMCPEQQKLGGGSRVKQVSLVDNWKIMTNNESEDNYNQSYGQQYTYKETNGNSSGVATYEPLGCKENPLVKPFYDNRKGSGLLLGGESENYIEEPLGESFFPASKVTYRRVEVKNLPRTEGTGVDEKIVKKHATGTVVTEFFTTKDYPTIASKTEITTAYDATPFFFSALFATTKKHITMSQGFAVHTNDMDGKMRSQRVYQEGNKVNAISGVDYNYYNQSNNGGTGLLNNEITTINSHGKIEKNIVGVDYDVINDFRQNESFNEINGAHLNFAILPTPPPIFLFLPTPLPTHIANQDLLKTAVTTKVIHSCGILRETVAYDNNSKVSTENLAWDAETGAVLLTKTANEYNDNYYSFNYPAYWNQDYKNMGQAAKNLDLVSSVLPVDAANGVYRLSSSFSNQVNKYLTNGDEIWYVPTKTTKLFEEDENTPTPAKAWVVNVTASSFNLIAANGVKVNHSKLKDGTFKIIKSGYKNNQMDNMASVTSMTNPLSTAAGGYLKSNLFDTAEADYKIVNASAIKYKEEWAGQCEGNLPKMIFGAKVDGEDKLKFQYNENNTDLDSDEVVTRSYNPYLNNILGNWRPVKSFAYLTGRTTATTAVDPKTRSTGYFKEFKPFYILSSGTWSTATGANYDKWTFASEVAKYNPYGQEVENKDALDRFSSAQYGYNYKFPLAVSSNSEYREMGYDGFEDYNTVLTKKAAHFNFMEILEAYKNNNEVILSTIQAHSGRKSIRVQPKAKATLTKKLVTCTGTIDLVPANKNADKTIK